MQCALTSSAAAQRVQARRTPGRRPLTVQATAQPQTTTGMPKPKWAGAARRGDRQARRRQLTPLWPVAPGRLVRHLMVRPLRLHRSPATPLGSRRASGACASAAAASLVFRAAVPTIHAPSLMCACICRRRPAVAAGQRGDQQPAVRPAAGGRPRPHQGATLPLLPGDPPSTPPTHHTTAVCSPCSSHMQQRQQHQLCTLLS